MHVLELFSGYGSVTEYFATKRGITVVSLDMDPKMQPSICADILKWDYEAAFPRGHFDIIWASPECKEYSRANQKGWRDLRLADSLVCKTLEIINYFKPRSWYIENPQTGLLKTRPFMQGLPYYDVTYCMYGFDYMKPTRIWTNVAGFQPRFCKFDCPAMTDFGHKRMHKIAIGSSKRPNWTRVYNRQMSCRIPQPLLHDLFACAM